MTNKNDLNEVGVALPQPCSAFVLDRMPWEKEWTIRIVIPGIDGRHAVWLETTCERETKDEAEVLLDQILDGLRDACRERQNAAAQAPLPKNKL